MRNNGTTSRRQIFPRRVEIPAYRLEGALRVLRQIQGRSLEISTLKRLVKNAGFLEQEAHDYRQQSEALTRSYARKDVHGNFTWRRGEDGKEIVGSPIIDNQPEHDARQDELLNSTVSVRYFDLPYHEIAQLVPNQAILSAIDFMLLWEEGEDSEVLMDEPEGEESEDLLQARAEIEAGSIEDLPKPLDKGD